jgi:hypothetical protein
MTAIVLCLFLMIAAVLLEARWLPLIFIGLGTLAYTHAS